MEILLSLCQYHLSLACCLVSQHGFRLSAPPPPDYPLSPFSPHRMAGVAAGAPAARLRHSSPAAAASVEGVLTSAAVTASSGGSFTPVSATALHPVVEADAEEYLGGGDSDDDQDSGALARSMARQALRRQLPGASKVGEAPRKTAHAVNPLRIDPDHPRAALSHDEFLTIMRAAAQSKSLKV